MDLATQISSSAHQASIQAIIQVGGADPPDDSIHAAWVADTASGVVDNFVKNLLAAMDALGYDGLDLDWEPFNASDEPLMASLATKLRAARPSMLLTMPIGALNVNYQTPVDAFYGDNQATFDQLNVMTYDMSGPYEGWQSWYFSPIYGQTGSTPVSIDSSVQAYLAAGVPASKLGIGIGFYGDCWQGVTGPKQSITARASSPATTR